MTLPTTTVEIAFNSPFNSFTLDDATKGVLDNTAFTLGGDVLTDITSFVRGVNVRRGKSRILDDLFQTGTAQVILDNRARTFDPTVGTAISPFGGQIEPRRDVAVKTSGSAVYFGQIQDWNFDYALGGDATATVAVVDAFASLSQTTLSTSFTPIEQLTSERVEAVLDRPEVGWPSDRRDIGTGNATLASATAIPENTTALNYLNTVSISEAGAFFTDKEGNLQFDPRNQAPTSTTAFTFSDDGAASTIPYTEIQVEYGSELLFNRIVVTRDGGTDQIVTDSDSQASYGVLTNTLATFLNTDADALALANFTLGLRKDPQVRFSALTVAMESLTSTQQSQVLSLELNDVVTVKFLPSRNFGAVGSAIEQFVFIENIEHDIGLERHLVRFGLGATARALLILDDAIFGKLDDDKLLGF
jgi:hypothetical protein